MSIAKCIADKTTKSDSSCVVADWNAGNASTPGFILNKPTIPAAQVQADWNATSGVSSILNKPTIPAAQVQADWNATSGVSSILNKPALSPGAGSVFYLTGTISTTGYTTLTTAIPATATSVLITLINKTDGFFDAFNVRVGDTALISTASYYNSMSATYNSSWGLSSPIVVHRFVDSWVGSVVGYDSVNVMTSYVYTVNHAGPITRIGMNIASPSGSATYVIKAW